jgi:hypothetical protein
MAKTRMLKHDLRTSEKVATWPIEIRYFWALLWGYVDDHGKGKDNPLLVKADCFPLDPQITADIVDGWLWRLTEAQVIARYIANGTDYLQVVNWSEHQKPPHPTKDILPGFDHPDAARRELHAPCMNDAGNTPAPLTHGLGLGLGLTGSGSGLVSSPAAMDRAKPKLADIFDIAYSHWPKKVERKVALERFETASKRMPPDELADHIIRFGDAYEATTTKQFTPALGVWIGHERWTDELPTAPEADRKPTRSDENLAYVQSLYRDDQPDQMEIEQ